jgi:lipocalin-like protein
VSNDTQNDATCARLIGTWKLVSVVNEDVSTGVKSDYFGPNPDGYINYGPDGRMIVINTRADRAKPKGASPTPAEAADLFRSVLAYAGTYTIEGNEVTHHVDISWNEAWTGTHQMRIARFDGERVHLSTKPTPDPVDGRMSVRTMTWEKMK